MTDTNSYLLSDARNALKSQHLLSAIQSLQGMATLLKAWNEAEELEDLSNAYHTLLSYFSQGIKDPDRIRLYNNFVCRSYEISDRLERLNVLKNDAHIYTVSLLDLQKSTGTDTHLSDYLQTKPDYKNLFRAVWLSAAWKTEEESAINRYLNDAETDPTYKCLVLSATTLSTMYFFDIAKFRTLLQFASSENALIRTRALTGIVFTVIFFADRIALYPQVSAQLKLLTDSKQFIQEFGLIQAQLFLSLETKRIEKNLQEEIIPHVMKQVEHIKLNQSLGTDELNRQMTEELLNPEWKKNAETDKLAQYMQEIEKLQQRGADLYMGTFKMLKQKFPFFREISNWFYPFTLDHPEIPSTSRNNKILQLLLQGQGLCDSDKYSFCLITHQLKNSLPEEKLQEFISQNRNNLNTLTPAGESTQDFKELLRSYIQGFYRFCNLYVYRQDFPNPFQQDLLLVNYSPFHIILQNKEFTRRIADLAFQDQAYAIALSLYTALPVQHTDITLYQKIGFCYEQEQQLDEAIEQYTAAHDINPSDTWTLRRLSACLRTTGKYQEALSCYNSLADIYPEDANIAFRQGECHLLLHQYDEALKAFFKSDYLKENSLRTMRALAWCSLLTQKYSQAEQYYQKIISNNPTPTDYLNAGHAAWLSGNTALTISRYLKAVPTEGKTDFLQEDKDMLHQNGITDAEISIMTDAVLSAMK